MMPTYLKSGEFADSRGEIQRPGDPNARGLSRPLPPNIPIAPAPPAELVVVSTFDTRPIGALDFAQTGFMQFPGPIEDPTTSIRISVPDGYITVLRRVAIYFGSAPYIVSPSPGFPPDFVAFQLTRSGAPIPYNEVRLIGTHFGVDWPTHHIFGPGETFGLSAYSQGSSPPTTTIAAVFTGTLIPYHGQEAAVSIASLPVLVDPIRKKA